MGYCSYQRNPSELYRDTKPGTAPETICGARTFPAQDDPELVTVRVGMSSDGAIYETRPSGRYVARPTDDPYCPKHGGSPEPPPPPVDLYDLERAYAMYSELAARFAGQPGGALASLPAPPAELAAAAAAAAPPALPIEAPATTAAPATAAPATTAAPPPGPPASTAPPAAPQAPTAAPPAGPPDDTGNVPVAAPGPPGGLEVAPELAAAAAAFQAALAAAQPGDGRAR